MKSQLMKTFCLWALLSAPTLLAQTAPEGIWQGYDGEWRHVSRQLIALAEATPGQIRMAPCARSSVHE